MKSMMKGIAAGILAVAVVIAGQMALSRVAGFHTAELIGGTVLTFLFFYYLSRSGRKRLEAKAEKTASYRPCLKAGKRFSRRAEPAGA